LKEDLLVFNNKEFKQKIQINVEGRKEEINQETNHTKMNWMGFVVVQWQEKIEIKWFKIINNQNKWIMKYIIKDCLKINDWMNEWYN